MKCTPYRSHLLVVAFFLATAGLMIGQEQQTNPLPATTSFAGAKVSDWKGTIRISLPGQSASSPIRGELLPPGSQLDTEGGQLLLQLADGSQVLVRAHTRLMVQQPSPTDRGYFQLLLGSIRALITKRTGGATPFELGTPSAVIAVRGTKFDVAVDKRQRTAVDVLEGVVEVFGRRSGRSVLVNAGSSTSVGMNTPPDDPKPSEKAKPEAIEPGSKGKGPPRGRNQ